MSAPAYIYRRADVQVCQGHGARCDCYDGCDSGHGVVSYCDNTCAGARWAYLDMLEARRVERPADSDEVITLDVHGSDGQSYRVAFEGTDAQAWALAYLAARRSTHHFVEAMDAPFSYATFPQFAEALYPMCDHGMSADLCMGPDHFMSYAQERALFG